jgi:signal transduction histidine kinase
VTACHNRKVEVVSIRWNVDVAKQTSESEASLAEANATLRRANERYEESAKRISYALHNDAGQLLASAAIELERVGQEVPDRKNELRRVASLLDEIHHVLRRLSHELRPPLLDQLGLLPALRFLAEGVSERSGIAVRVHGELDQRPPGPVENAVYRMVQEALDNVVEHSGAGKAAVRVWKERCGTMVEGSIATVQRRGAVAAWASSRSASGCASSTARCRSTRPPVAAPIF